MNQTGFIIDKIRFVFICTYLLYGDKKIMGVLISRRNVVIYFFMIILIDFINIYAKINNYFLSVICISIIYSLLQKTSVSYSFIVNLVSLTISQATLFGAGIVTYFIENLIGINNETFEFIVIEMMQFILIFMFWKIKRFKKGISFLKKYKENEYINIMLLNVGVGILFTIMIISNYRIRIGSKFGIMFIIFIATMIGTILKTIKIDYKHQMLIKTLQEKDLKLQEDEEKIKSLEAENLETMKTMHTIEHRQRAMKYKLEQLSKSNDKINKDLINNQIDEITKDFHKKCTISLNKTGIDKIDDMLEFMQSECIKNNIEFQLQLNGNIFTMINNVVSEKDLEILLADHIKDAIIAISCSDNINRSVLVKLGKINNIYSIYFYDSGIEFEEDTLNKLGKVQVTTHKESGGTGLGFLNTFKTLDKYNASLEIEEIGKPSKDNYTKIIKIKFDNKHKFEINSYKREREK